MMMLTLMLPYEVIMVPQYILFAKLGWLNSYQAHRRSEIISGTPSLSF